MDTRKNIEDTAARLFYEQGYNSTGINQIIAEAGVAKASLYVHFPSKVELLKSYFLNTSTTLNAELNRIIQQKETPKEKVLSIFDFLAKFSNESNFNGCHFLNIAAEVSQQNKDVLLIIQEQKDKIRQLFVNILKPIGKENLSDELYILFEGSLAGSKIFQSKWTMDATRRIVDKLI